MLEKPGFTSPPLIYAVAWTGFQVGFADGGYRLLRTVYRRGARWC